ncbi:MAG: hypothetical protein NXI20_18750 [bacterium]|nr:hypothetical protein [bacterium]
MYCLISIQGKYAAHYRFRKHTAQSFKDLIQGLTGSCCTAISSRFRTDLIYFSKKLTHKDVLKLWSMHIDEELTRKQRHLFIFKSGKENVLNHYFNSLNQLCQIHDWYNEYVEEFNHLYALDSNNPILKLIAGCDKHLVSKEKVAKRAPLVGGDYYNNYSDEKRIISLLRDVLEKPERSN